MLTFKIDHSKQAESCYKAIANAREFEVRKATNTYNSEQHKEIEVLIDNKVYWIFNMLDGTYIVDLLNSKYGLNISL